MRRVHRFALYRIIGNGLAGIICLVFPIYLTGNLMSNWMSGSSSFVSTLMLGLVALLMALAGLLAAFTVLVNRVVVSPEGLEYHFTSGVLASDWKDLTVEGWVKLPSQGQHLILKSKNPRVKRRRWAIPALWGDDQHMRQLGIPVSQFGLWKGRKLVQEIQEYAPFLEIEKA